MPPNALMSCPQIMITSTGLCLAAARFGLAPSAKKVASAGLKLTDRPVDLMTNDPAGVSDAQGM